MVHSVGLMNVAAVLALMNGYRSEVPEETGFTALALNNVVAVLALTCLLAVLALM